MSSSVSMTSASTVTVTLEEDYDYFVGGDSTKAYTTDQVSDITFNVDTSHVLSNPTLTHGDYTITISQDPFIDCMPDLQTVSQMCDHYPALNKAYENFKTVYKLVEQDYKGNVKKDIL